MTEFTVVHTNNWNLHGNKIKEIIKQYNLLWNSNTIQKNVSIEEIKNIYIKYKIEDLFNNNQIDTGSIGYYESIFGKIKIVKIVDSIILIYKELYCNNDFHRDFIKTCRDVGCTIIKIVDDKIVFRNKLNIELTNKLNNKEDEKNIRTKNFIQKIELLEKEFKEHYTTNFTKDWKDCLRGNKHE